MKDAGSALMGIGRASGENRAVEAAQQAIASPLLEVNITGAQGVLFNITGGPEPEPVRGQRGRRGSSAPTADPEANIIFGTVIDERMGDEVMITVIATGFDASRRRDIGRLDSPHEVASGLRAGRDNRDFLAALAADRPLTTAGTPVMEPAERRERSPERAERPERVEAPRRPTFETEDLDIPAFLRRNK